jgi:hypothetical protein
MLQVFLASVLVGDEWSASRSACITPGERALFTHWMEVWVGHKAGLDKKK